MGKAVGYCDNCFLTADDCDHNSNTGSKSPLMPPSQITESLDGNDGSEDDESDDPTPSATKVKNKKRGRKGYWTTDSLDDFIDIIASNKYYTKKLIFTNTKNQKNASIYEEILTELKKRCANRGEECKASVSQLRNKFKKCVAECKKTSLTIKTATGIGRFQEDKGYGNWFKVLFQLVMTRDSCQPEQAIEPSACSISTSEEASSHNASDHNSETPKLFVPIRAKKPKKEDVLQATHDLIKKTLENDKTDSMIQLMKEEFEQSRQHELKLFQMLFDSNNNQAQQPSTDHWQGQFSAQYQPRAGFHQNTRASGYSGSTIFNQPLRGPYFPTQPQNDQGSGEHTEHDHYGSNQYHTL